MSPRSATAERLVRTRIRGVRKGARGEPASAHSFRVAETLRKHGYPESVRIAGLLHDVVEDGGVTFRELVRLGFPPRVVEIVRLCSHDPRVRNRDARWELLIAGLISARDDDAWAVKIADVLDNFRQSKTLSPDRARFFRSVKAPLVLHVSEDVMLRTPIWKELKAEIEKSRERTLYHFLRDFLSLKQFDGIVTTLRQRF